MKIIKKYKLFLESTFLNSRGESLEKNQNSGSVEISNDIMIKLDYIEDMWRSHNYYGYFDDINDKIECIEDFYEKYGFDEDSMLSDDDFMIEVYKINGKSFLEDIKKTYDELKKLESESHIPTKEELINILTPLQDTISDNFDTNRLYSEYRGFHWFITAKVFEHEKEDFLNELKNLDEKLSYNNPKLSIVEASESDRQTITGEDDEDDIEYTTYVLYLYESDKEGKYISQYLETDIEENEDEDDITEGLVSKLKDVFTSPEKTAQKYIDLLKGQVFNLTAKSGSMNGRTKFEITIDGHNIYYLQRGGDPKTILYIDGKEFNPGAILKREIIKEINRISHDTYNMLSKFITKSHSYNYGSYPELLPEMTREELKFRFDEFDVIKDYKYLDMLSLESLFKFYNIELDDEKKRLLVQLDRKFIFINI